MPEYVFEFPLNATGHLDAASEEQARRHLSALGRITTTNLRIPTADGDIRIADIHLADDAEDADLTDTLPDRGTTGPLYRAGSDAYETVIAPVNEKGWDCYEDASGESCTWVSPNRELSLEFGPEFSASRIASLWRVTYRDPDPYRGREKSFVAYFNGNVPAEAIAAFLTALTTPSRHTDNESENEER